MTAVDAYVTLVTPTSLCGHLPRQEPGGQAQRWACVIPKAVPQPSGRMAEVVSLDLSPKPLGLKS